MDDHNAEKPTVQPDIEESLVVPPADSMSSSKVLFPNLKSSLGDRMCATGQSPPSIPHAPPLNSSAQTAFEIPQTAHFPGGDTRYRKPDDFVARSRAFAQEISAEPQAFSLSKWVSRIRSPNTRILAASLMGVAFFAGVLTGFVAGANTGQSVADEQRRALDQLKAQLAERDDRLSSLAEQARVQTEKLKQNSAQSVAGQQSNERLLIAKIDEAQKTAKILESRYSDAERKRQDAEDELEKVMAFVTPTEEGIIDWPSDPPKVFPTANVDLRFQSSNIDEDKTTRRTNRKNRAARYSEER
jgi:gas vesicle protein